MTTTSKTKLILTTSLLSALFTVSLFSLTNYAINHSWNFFATDQSKNPPLTVTGTASIKAIPDKTTVSFTVNKTAATLQDAQNQTNTFTNKIVADLQKSGISKNDIQTSNYNSSPNYNDQAGIPNGMLMRSSQSQTIISYTVSEYITITIYNNDKTNIVIDTITKDNAENISGPALAFSDTLQQTLENDARTKAIANAKQKAQNMAIAAGIHLGKLVKIQEENPNPIFPMMMNSTALGSAKTIPTQINPGQNTVSASVTLSYQTY
ncbi:MAG TPA: SIMPL domain-containing protein [Candidatus Sulfotelmatobacter sp.]|jgi:uncharacterized protein YggE|nr:SIMPL domain-containing protein [Candidatus Sulfotelmatobacter sp.]